MMRDLNYYRNWATGCGMDISDTEILLTCIEASVADDMVDVVSAFVTTEAGSNKGMAVGIKRSYKSFRASMKTISKLLKQKDYEGAHEVIEEAISDLMMMGKEVEKLPLDDIGSEKALIGAFKLIIAQITGIVGAIFTSIDSTSKEFVVDEFKMLKKVLTKLPSDVKKDTDFVALKKQILDTFDEMIATLASLDNKLESMREADAKKLMASESTNNALPMVQEQVRWSIDPCNSINGVSFGATEDEMHRILSENTGSGYNEYCRPKFENGRLVAMAMRGVVIECGGVELTSNEINIDTLNDISDDFSRVDDSSVVSKDKSVLVCVTPDGKVSGAVAGEPGYFEDYTTTPLTDEESVASTIGPMLPQQEVEYRECATITQESFDDAFVELYEDAPETDYDQMVYQEAFFDDLKKKIASLAPAKKDSINVNKVTKVCTAYTKKVGAENRMKLIALKDGAEGKASSVYKKCQKEAVAAEKTVRNLLSRLNPMEKSEFQKFCKGFDAQMKDKYNALAKDIEEAKAHLAASVKKESVDFNPKPMVVFEALEDDYKSLSKQLKRDQFEIKICVTRAKKYIKKQKYEQARGELAKLQMLIDRDRTIAGAMMRYAEDGTGNWDTQIFRTTIHYITYALSIIAAIVGLWPPAVSVALGIAEIVHEVARDQTGLDNTSCWTTVKYVALKARIIRYYDRMENILAELTSKCNDAEFVQFTEESTSVFVQLEAANIDVGIKEIIKTLNKKGYKTKYSSAGHNGLRWNKGKDRNNNAKPIGTLSNDARIMFDGNYKFPPAPKHWKWRTVDGNDYLDIIEIKYDPKDGSPSEAFQKYKGQYLSTLKTWVDNLPWKTKDMVEESTPIDDDFFNTLMMLCDSSTTPPPCDVTTEAAALDKIVTAFHDVDRRIESAKFLFMRAGLDMIHSKANMPFKMLIPTDDYELLSAFPASAREFRQAMDYIKAGKAYSARVVATGPKSVTTMMVAGVKEAKSKNIPGKQRSCVDLPWTRVQNLFESSAKALSIVEKAMPNQIDPKWVESQTEAEKREKMTHITEVLHIFAYIHAAVLQAGREVVLRWEKATGNKILKS